MGSVTRERMVGDYGLDRCDIRIWSGTCEHETYSNSGERYLCVTCGTIPDLDHEVRHEIFPHIKGDSDFLH